MTRNPEIGNTLVWVLSDILWLDRIMDTNFGTNVSKMVLNAVKIQSYSFYRFWVIKGKPTGKEGGGLPHSPKTRVKEYPQLKMFKSISKKNKKQNGNISHKNILEVAVLKYFVKFKITTKKSVMSCLLYDSL